MKKSYTPEQQYLLRRLAAFTPVYERAITKFLLNLSEGQYPKVKEDETYYYHLNIDNDILRSIDDEWADVRDVFLRTYNSEYTDIHREYTLNVLIPMYRNMKVDKVFEAWWKETYRKYALDFNIPAAPFPLQKQITKIDRYTFQIGQLTVKFEGDKKWRMIGLYAGTNKLDHFEASWVNLNDAKAILEEHYLPLLLPILRLCDWSKLSSMTKQQQNALGKRYQAIKKAQRNFTSWSIHEIINNRAEKKGA